MSAEVKVASLPKCDFCKEDALYDALTIAGPWAYMCEKHFRLLSFQRLETGWGQKLILDRE